MSDSPIILIAGQEKCGKSSIIDVVFKRKSVYKTFFLISTSSLNKYTSRRNLFMEYNIWELPSDFKEIAKEFANIKSDIKRVKVLIYVISLEVARYGEYYLVEYVHKIQRVPSSQSFWTQ